MFEILLSRYQGKPCIQGTHLEERRVLIASQSLRAHWSVMRAVLQSAHWLLESHVAMCWLLAIGITDCQASQARWWGIGFGVVSAFVLFAWLALWSLSRAGDGCDCCCYHFRGYAMDMVVLDCQFAGSRWTW